MTEIRHSDFRPGYVVWLLFSLLILNACNKNQPGQPAYLKVQDAELVVGSGQGSSSDNINCLWMSSGNNDFGVSEIPFTIPVLISGTHSVVLNAGVKQNGIAATRIIYPFFLPDTIDIDANPLDTVELHPSFRYKPATQFSLIEDFEFGNAFSNMSRDVTAADQAPLGSSACGLIRLDSITDSTVSAKMINPIDIPLSASTWVEMDYRNPGQPFALYLEAHNGSDQINSKLITITAHEDWNKIYIDLSSTIGQLTGADAYYFYFGASIPDGVDSSRIYIDNFKVLHF